MRLSPAVFLSVVGAAILVACGDNTSTTPRANAPGRADASGNPNQGSCNFNNVKSAAGNYFISNRDTVYGLIKSMSGAYTGGGGAVAATPYGWLVLGRVADKRLTDSVTNSAAGATFVVATVGCMADLAANSVPLTLPTTLTASSNLLLTRILNSGIWEIRTGGTLGAAAAGKDKEGGVRSFGSPIWGVEPASVTTNWPGSVTYAVFGYPTTVGSPLLTAPTNIDQNDDLGQGATSAYQVAGTWPFNAFELGTAPATAVADHSSLRVGICYTNNPAGDGSVNFLVHNNNELVPASSPTQLCNLTQASADAPSRWYALVHNTLAFFRPTLLFAQDDNFIGGLPSGWSPFGPGAVTASGVTLKVTTQPKNNVADSTDNSLVVTSTLTGTNPLVTVPHVKVDSIVVFNNSGTPAGAVIVTGSTNLPVFTSTDGTGTATVHFAIGKPGGYSIVVWGSVDGAPLSPANSGKFNVKNQ